ncbi:MAG: alpha-amylase family glycosyl hydrolase, partial [Acidimicrobiales bacterium]
MPILPSSTYRLQLGPSLGLEGAIDLLPYLGDLGVSHLYLSPVFEAATGSTHGYDVVDPGTVSSALGGLDAFTALAAAARQRGMGLVVDIVPNHMATSIPDNAWFRDVLAQGRSSRYADHFDIDWGDDDRVLLPVLGDHYGRELDRRQFRLSRTGANIELAYRDRRFPLAAPSLAGLYDGVGDGIDSALALVNDDPDRLHDILERQHYRLAHWRLSRERLGYRRFLDIDTLIGLRVEDRPVFEDVHRLVIDWALEGLIDGVRVDHPDGLRRPTEYFRRLRDALPSAWIVAEKILEPGEELPGSWPVDGTTGYEHLNILTGLFVDPSAEAAFTGLHRELTGETGTFAQVADGAKREILGSVLG